METNGWLPTLRNNGLPAAYAFGEYLGTRYKGFPNVAWMSGNDFVTWKDRKDDSMEQAVAKGIKSADPGHLQTVELNYETSSSFDDPTWVPLISLNSTYTYSPTYMQMLHSYNQTPIAPTYLVEAHYDQENVGHPAQLRHALHTSTRRVLDHVERRHRTVLWELLHLVVLTRMEILHRHGRRNAAHHLEGFLFVVALV